MCDMIKPAFEGVCEFAPICVGLAEERRILALLFQQLFQRIERCLGQQLRGCAVGRYQRHRSKGTCIASAARIDRMVENDATTDEGANEKIDRIREFWPTPECQFSTASDSGVILHEDRIAAALLHNLCNVDILPDIHRTGWCANLFLPIPKLEGHADADACDFLTIFFTELSRSLFNGVTGEIQQLIRHRISIGDPK